MPGESEAIQSLFITLPNQYATYSARSSNTVSNTVESKTLDDQIQKLNLQIQDIERKEQTYDREFLDRKSNPPKKGFFHSIGLRTTEDFVFAYFFFSYLIFFLMMFIIILIYSTRKIIAGALVIGAGLILGFLILFLLYRYA
jgi:hypothetical protein